MSKPKTVSGNSYACDTKQEAVRWEIHANSSTNVHTQLTAMRAVWTTVPFSIRIRPTD